MTEERSPLGKRVAEDPDFGICTAFVGLIVYTDDIEVAEMEGVILLTPDIGDSCRI